MNKVEIGINERIDDLQYKNLKIVQDKTGFCFGIDSVILSDFAKEIKENSKVVDLGTGTGIISILLCGKTKLKNIIGIDIQEEVVKMAKKSVILNDLEEKFTVFECDIKNIIKENVIEKNSIDVIVTNPPYKEIGNGVTNENEKKLISRHEVKAKLSDFIEISSKLLKDKGSFYMVHKPERLIDIVYEMRINKIEPKEIRFVYPSKSKETNLILIKGVKGGKKFLKIDKPLYIYEEDGSYTNEIKNIYKTK